MDEEMKEFFEEALRDINSQLSYIYGCVSNLDEIKDLLNSINNNLNEIARNTEPDIQV